MLRLSGVSAMTELRPLCDCGKRVRVLWSGPINEDSRPVQLVCGNAREDCGFRQDIPEDAVQMGKRDPEQAAAIAREVAQMKEKFGDAQGRLGNGST